MSVFGSTIKESLSTTTLSDATLTNSLKEVTVRRIPVNEGREKILNKKFFQRRHHKLLNENLQLNN